MRLSTFLVDGQLELGALLQGDTAMLRLQATHQTLHGSAAPALASMLAFLNGAQAARELAQATLEAAQQQRPDGVLRPMAGVTLLSPLPRPESIREFMTFEQHVINCARKFGMPPWRAALDERIERTFGRKATKAYRDNQAWYAQPVYYKGNRFNVVGHDAEVRIPRYTKAFDWELEFGIFLCQGGRDISAKDAHRHIGGYAVFNDFSARDIQGREMGGRLGPAKGKDFDTGNSIGPVLVTPDEVPDPYALAMTARIDGQEVSRGNSAGMRYRFEDIIAYVSQSETLHVGEFFGSGTATLPESGKDRRGCGLEMGRFLKAGETIELEVQGLGVLRNRIVAG